MSLRTRLTAVAATAACLTPATAGAYKIKAPPPTGSAVTDFGLDAYAQLSANDGNLAFSPSSIFLALAILEQGAGPQDAATLDRVLHLDKTTSIADVDKDLRGLTGVDLGNGLWIAKKDKFKRAYLKSIKKSLHAELASIDFRRHPEQARRSINKWIAKHTGGKIAHLLPAGSIDKSTEIVLASAIHFLGKWADAFDAADTADGTFVLGDGTKATTSMMHRTGPARLSVGGDATMLEMPYADGSLAMDVVVPADGVALKDLESSIQRRYMSWVNGLGASEDVKITLPKWHVDQQVDLPTLLRALGLGMLFDGMSLEKILGDQRTFAVSGAFHQTIVDVTEKGTEAAAATGIVMKPTMVRQTPTFAADRPFLWVIRDTKSNAILFMGRVADPR